MKKCLFARSLIGFVTGALVVHVITLLVNYFGRGQYLICMPKHKRLDLPEPSLFRPYLPRYSVW